MTTDDFDLNDIGSSPEAAAETPNASSEAPSETGETSEETSEPTIEVEDDEEQAKETEDAEPLGEIVDPRLATVEGGSVLDTSIPDPRLVTTTPREPEAISAGSTIEQLQAELAAAIEARDFAHGSYQSAVTKLQAAEEAGARVGISLADEMRLRNEAETALRETQSVLLTESMKASALSSDLDAARTELARLERDFAALSKRHIFQIIPAFKEGQKRDTRIYILADDAADAIRRVEKAGLLTSGEVENVTKTSQKLVI